MANSLEVCIASNLTMISALFLGPTTLFCTCLIRPSHPNETLLLLMIIMTVHAFLSSLAYHHHRDHLASEDDYYLLLWLRYMRWQGASERTQSSRGQQSLTLEIESSLGMGLGILWFNFDRQTTTTIDPTITINESTITVSSRLRAGLHSGQIINIINSSVNSDWIRKRRRRRSEKEAWNYV